jgi:hypothetical protein
MSSLFLFWPMADCGAAQQTQAKAWEKPLSGLLREKEVEQLLAEARRDAKRKPRARLNERFLCTKSL